MTTRMLIDARHREETRIAVVKNGRIEEFDFESAERKQLKGNIYLAKVTRVEPSLQAAFIDYGGNRHGFLAFSEIHPDYYQIPKEDRDALLREEAEHAAEEAALRAEREQDAGDEDGSVEVVERGEDEGTSSLEEEETDDHVADEESPRRSGGPDDAVEALRQRRLNLRRRYKIQDVIRRRQVLLVQVVKEERGNKGAALTTYLSLAGRYCVLMPNTSHGGGISRKISNAGDRKRLKSIMADLSLPPSMGCIVRTAGLQRTKSEIKRDFDYLARLWDEIRERTLGSAAPALVYGDSDLIKRAIRDIYNKDIDEVIVEGEDGYRHAKDFMKLLMPSHARRVKHYADAVPLYQRANVEDQLAAMYHPVVQLKSGGYLVINPTEALVSIDINSGRSTREHNIEQTATSTNLEAAEEIARQLRLRDMAGLVVIDFIDMDNGSNVRKVEKAMKEALKNDRARIQVGRISSFGLMEMSRQRLRTGVLEASTRSCPHCEGTGLVRTASSAGLSALRLIEDEAARGRGSLLTLRASTEAAVYVLNRKRGDIAEIEDRYGVQVEILPDGEQEGARMSVEASGPPPEHAPRIDALIEEADDDEIEEEIDLEEDEEEANDEAEESRPQSRRSDEEGTGRRRRRRGRGRRGRSRDETEERSEEDSGSDEDAEPAVADNGNEPRSEDENGNGNGETRRRRSRRGRRGRRRDGNGSTQQGQTQDGAGDEETHDAVVIGDEGPGDNTGSEPDAEFVGSPKLEVAEKPTKARRRPRAKVAEQAEADASDAAPKPKRRTRTPKAADETEAVAPAQVDEPVKPKRRASRKKATEPEPELAGLTEETGNAAVVAAGDVAAEDAAGDAAEPTAPGNPPAPGNDTEAASPKRGWWQKTFGG